ncbi:GNAT family N-acetyltransferase [Zavarzinia sp. CC-PAN008]|uniref:GNAT family N-acetyltransferase n=1 Tax=Zavarzinia sp. CC-PAN008 TaxID=3243332 RepID=UPI003F742F64
MKSQGLNGLAVADIRSYPFTIDCDGVEVELRLMRADDAAAVLHFAKDLPAHDLLFLRRDISHPKVVSAWLEEIEQGHIVSVLALTEDGVVRGCGTLVRDELSWSPHVAELRVVVSSTMRGKGLGRILTQECFALALGLGLEKLVAQMTIDQKGAIAVFEALGFRGEALLRDHVRDRAGVKHDLVILSYDVAKHRAQHSSYTLSEAF